MKIPPPSRHPVPDHIPDHLHEAFATAQGGTIKSHCPYKLGDPVRLHGFAGEQPGHRRTGFRGWVVATVGATILTGITTTGEEWWEEWGRLEPDGLPLNIWRWCTCCAEERRPLVQAAYAKQRAEAAREQARGEQLDLFGQAVTA
jgi:hypothetical protein